MDVLSVTRYDAPPITASDMIYLLKELDPDTQLHVMSHDSEWSYNYKYAVTGVSETGYIERGKIVDSWSDYEDEEWANTDD